MDPSKFSLTTDPNDPQNSVLITGDITRLASVFVRSHPFVNYAEPVNAEAEHSMVLMVNPNAGPPLTESERTRQCWRLNATLYRSLYETVVMRGEKSFHPKLHNTAPSANESVASSFSTIPAPPLALPKTRPRSSSSTAGSMAPPPPLNRVERSEPQFGPEILQIVQSVSKDLNTLKEKMQHTMKVLLDVRDAIIVQPASESDHDDDEAPAPKRMKSTDRLDRRGELPAK